MCKQHNTRLFGVNPSFFHSFALEFFPRCFCSEGTHFCVPPNLLVPDCLLLALTVSLPEKVRETCSSSAYVERAIGDSDCAL